MLNQFSRTQLLFGKEAMERLYNARVAVFGVGGVGGYTVEALARSGIGTLDLIDDDKVCLTNLNRQILATRKTVGKYKVDVAEERIHDINPDAVVNTYKRFPKVPLIMAHCGFFWEWELAIEVAMENDNLYLETSRVPGFETSKVIQKLGGDKVIWGTDGPFCDYEWEFNKIRRYAKNAEEFDKIMGGTVLSLLRKE